MQAKRRHAGECIHQSSKEEPFNSGLLGQEFANFLGKTMSNLLQRGLDIIIFGTGSYGKTRLRRTALVSIF